jgi:hypothetical protein
MNHRKTIMNEGIVAPAQLNHPEISHIRGELRDLAPGKDSVSRVMEHKDGNPQLGERLSEWQSKHEREIVLQPFRQSCLEPEHPYLLIRGALEHRIIDTLLPSE